MGWFVYDNGLRHGRVTVQQILGVECRIKIKWDKEFNNGPSKICEIHPLKNLKLYSQLKQTV